MKNNMNANATPEKKPKGRMIWLVSVFSIMVIAIGFSTAKWITETNGSNATTVAAFSANAGTNEASTAITLNNLEGTSTASYSFWISNKENAKVSEVTNQYSITVIFSESVPEGLSFDIDGTAGSASDDRKTYVFSNAEWKMGAGTEEKNVHTLTFTADYDVLDTNFLISGIEIIANIEQAD